MTQSKPATPNADAGVSHTLGRSVVRQLMSARLMTAAELARNVGAGKGHVYAVIAGCRSTPNLRFAIESYFGQPIWHSRAVFSRLSRASTLLGGNVLAMPLAALKEGAACAGMNAPDVSSQKLFIQWLLDSWQPTGSQQPIQIETSDHSE